MNRNFLLSFMRTWYLVQLLVASLAQRIFSLRMAKLPLNVLKSNKSKQKPRIGRKHEGLLRSASRGRYERAQRMPDAREREKQNFEPSRLLQTVGAKGR